MPLKCVGVKLHSPNPKKTAILPKDSTHESKKENDLTNHNSSLGRDGPKNQNELTLLAISIFIFGASSLKKESEELLNPFPRARIKEDETGNLIRQINPGGEERYALPPSSTSIVPHVQGLSLSLHFTFFFVLLLLLIPLLFISFVGGSSVVQCVLTACWSTVPFYLLEEKKKYLFGVVYLIIRSFYGIIFLIKIFFFLSCVVDS